MPLDMRAPQQDLSAKLRQPQQSAMMAQPVQQPQLSLEEVLNAISQYNKLGEALRRSTTMQEVGTRLAQIAEYAEYAVVNEADDWFDAHTLKRNMKEIKTYAGDFTKLATEADALNQRMTALYDDMGRILERYFEIPDDQPQTHPVDASQQKIEEKGALTPDTLELTPARPVKEDDVDLDMNNEQRSRRTDLLTLKAIVAVYARLKKKNPAMAAKFAHLPPEKMEELIWKLV